MQKRIVTYGFVFLLTVTATCKNNKPASETISKRPAVEDSMGDGKGAKPMEAKIVPFKVVHTYINGDVVYEDGKGNINVRDSNGKVIYEGTLIEGGKPRAGEFIFKNKNGEEVHFYPNGIRTVHNLDKYFKETQIR